MDFNFVTNRVATGALIHNEADLLVLIQAGITHIIDCCEPEDAGVSNHPDIHYLHNPTGDDGQHKNASWFEVSINFGLEALSHPKNKVLAHCAAGVNRGPSTCYALLRSQGLAADEAERLIRSARPQVGLPVFE